MKRKTKYLRSIGVNPIIDFSKTQLKILMQNRKVNSVHMSYYWISLFDSKNNK